MGHRAENDARCLARGFLHFDRQRAALGLQRLQADVADVPFESELEARIRAVEYGESGAGDFGSDAVAGQYEDFHVGPVKNINKNNGL